MNLLNTFKNEFIGRHIGPNEAETSAMLGKIGIGSLEELIDKTVPSAIRMKKDLDLPEAVSEFTYLSQLKEISLKNKVFKSHIGQGYYDTITPSVILRNIFENPGWYTQYTPYQAEISQGRLESLLNFQTMVSDLTDLPIANASLLDEATAAAEAMTMFFNALNKDHDHITRGRFFVDENVFPQTKDVILTRANPLQIEVVFGDFAKADINADYFGALVQYPAADGTVADHREFINKVHAAGAYVAMATDLLALTLLTPPGELGADAALGSAQRFGVPLGFGGPHAAFFSCKDEFKRAIPGRIIGVSIDSQNRRALRMALQTREQHIKREKATSNICTAQALLANMAAMYAVYHGPQGLKNIALKTALLTGVLSAKLKAAGVKVANGSQFDTLTIDVADAAALHAKANAAGINFRNISNSSLGISLDETTQTDDVNAILGIFNAGSITDADVEKAQSGIPASLERKSAYLLHPVFNSHHSETEMMRYIKMLENKDLSLNTSMISLGSCTMVERPCTSWGGRVQLMSRRINSRISRWSSFSPAITAARQAYVAANRSSAFFHPPNLPRARSATISRKHRVASNRGCGLGAVWSMTVRPPKEETSNPTCSKKGRDWSTTSSSSSVRSSVMGRRSRWAATGAPVNWAIVVS